MGEAPRKRRRKQAIGEEGDKLSNDLTYDILLRLPVKTLQRFKSVSKSWQALISDSVFVKSHLGRSNFNTANYCSIVNSYDNPHVRLTFLDRQASAVTFVCTNLVPSHVTEDDSNLFWPFRVLILGSCNGLILTTISSETQLWNPTTGESKTLARCALSHKYMHSRCYLSGLGYDRSLNEYKAIVFTSPEYLYDKSTSGMFLCTGSKTRGKWKSVDVSSDDFPYGITTVFSRSGVTVNGSPHWVVCKSREDYYPATIIYFDMVDEKFKMLPTLPPVHPMSLDTNIATLGGCLCAIYADRGAKSFDVWVMNEYGVTWTKLFVFRHPSGDYAAYAEHLVSPGSPFVETGLRTGLACLKHIREGVLVRIENLSLFGQVQVGKQ